MKPPQKKKLSEIERRHLSSLIYLMLLLSRYYQCEVTENRFLGGVEPKLLLENNLSTVRYEACYIFQWSASFTGLAMSDRSERLHVHSFDRTIANV